MAILNAEEYLREFVKRSSLREKDLKPEDVIRYIRIRHKENYYNFDILFTITKIDKKEVIIFNNFIIPKDANGKYIKNSNFSAEKVDSIEIDADFAAADNYPSTLSLSKKEMSDFISNKERQDKFITATFERRKDWRVIQDPWDPSITPPMDIPPVAETLPIAPAPQPVPVAAPIVASQSVSKIDADFIFNVEKDKVLQIVGDKLNLGELTIVRKEDPNNPKFMPSYEEEEVPLDEEYIEPDFAGAEEDPAIFEAFEDSQSAMPPGNFSESISESDIDNGKKSDVVSVITKAKTKIKSGKEFGSVGKVAEDADILDAMVRYVEGGYFSPAHVSKFNKRSQDLYTNSGETLWGIDRFAGQTETEEVGRKFWAAVDSISGYGDLGAYSRKTNSGKWDISKYPVRTNAWKYNYMPKPGDKGYDIMYSSFVNYAVSNLNDWLDKYFKSHPALKKMILSDARFKFMWFRSTWNGPGWFNWYANGKTNKKGVKLNGLKWAYDNVSKDLETLIKWDLNNRLVISNNNALIKHDVEKISSIIGLRNLA